MVGDVFEVEEQDPGVGLDVSMARPSIGAISVSGGHLQNTTGPAALALKSTIGDRPITLLPPFARQRKEVDRGVPFCREHLASFPAVLPDPTPLAHDCDITEQGRLNGEHIIARQVSAAVAMSCLDGARLAMCF